mmetsp:Transcript_49457/g.153541  ORF Transcript_49457/g.153541 Transcript_49457/m.153541 type:complete len:284 (+) Transcript_49457:2257-3108(+)
MRRTCASARAPRSAGAARRTFRGRPSRSTSAPAPGTPAAWAAARASRRGRSCGGTRCSARPRACAPRAPTSSSRRRRSSRTTSSSARARPCAAGARTGCSSRSRSWPTCAPAPGWSSAPAATSTSPSRAGTGTTAGAASSPSARPAAPTCSERCWSTTPGPALPCRSPLPGRGAPGVGSAWRRRGWPATTGSASPWCAARPAPRTSAWGPTRTTGRSARRRGGRAWAAGTTRSGGSWPPTSGSARRSGGAPAAGRPSPGPEASWGSTWRAAPRRSSAATARSG